ncbi:hypothetical protein RY831_32465 [Noviherbaspirillum sp. CPCC 100848]|uniref:Uncharacterized protein n=1 Tax=Noviherbaspirillum album TaxID=3080276 RepID=A0ABU6JJG6_9BURK|nr:hypothetical protein [Noviherbaspirillum sp. CPCC 100848]MEC4723832.1 hypothetical protein [Noviherbaspirillum sp. CPCC 100848]
MMTDDILILLYGSDIPGLVVSRFVCLVLAGHSTAVVTVIDQDWKNFRGKSNFYFSGLADALPVTCFFGGRRKFFSIDPGYFALPVQVPCEFGNQGGLQRVSTTASKIYSTKSLKKLKTLSLSEVACSRCAPGIDP